MAHGRRSDTEATKERGRLPELIRGSWAELTLAERRKKKSKKKEQQRRVEGMKMNPAGGYRIPPPPAAATTPRPGL